MNDYTRDEHGNITGMTIEKFEKFAQEVKNYKEPFTPFVLQKMAHDIVSNRFARNDLQCKEEDDAERLRIHVDLWNYLNQHHHEMFQKVKKDFTKATHTYYHFMPTVANLMKGKRLYVNKYKVFYVFEANKKEEGIALLTKLSHDKLQMVFMFIEGLFVRRLPLEELVFFTTLFFDVYELKNDTLEVFGEDSLANIDFSNIKHFSTCIDAIRNRHEIHQDIIVESDLLWKNMRMGDRGYRVLHYHEDKFDSCVVREESNYDKTTFLEYEYRLMQLTRNNGILDIAIYKLEMEKPEGQGVRILFEGYLLPDEHEVDFILELSPEEEAIEFEKYRSSETSEGNISEEFLKKTYI